MLIRDRVKELRRVRASDLRPSPKNWRTHPKAQADALKGLLAEVGFAGAVLARELPDGSLELIDGHLRAETAPDNEIPVLILDVTEVEADKLLATFDPLGAMAGANSDAIDQLLSSTNVPDPISAILQTLADENRDSPADLSESAKAERGLNSTCVVKLLVSGETTKDIEEAIRSTGEMNRAIALHEICRHYLETNEKGQLHILAESTDTRSGETVDRLAIHR